MQEGWRLQVAELRAFSSEVDPVRAKKTRQNKESRAPFQFNRNGKGSRVAKRDTEALALIRQAIDEGEMSARVMLATMADQAGLSRSEVDQMIADVETNISAPSQSSGARRGAFLDIGSRANLCNGRTRG